MQQLNEAHEFAQYLKENRSTLSRITSPEKLNHDLAKLSLEPFADERSYPYNQRQGLALTPTIVSPEFPEADVSYRVRKLPRIEAYPPKASTPINDKAHKSRNDYVYTWNFNNKKSF